MGGGSKVFAQKAPSSGETYRYHTTAGRMVTHSAAEFLGRRFKSCSGRRRRCGIGRTGVRTANQKVCSHLHYHSATANPDTCCSPNCLYPCLLLTKNPKCVFLSD